MTKILAITILLALAALDYAALDDITTGSEPGFAAEWTMLFLSVPIAWVVIRSFRKSQRAGTARVKRG